MKLTRLILIQAGSIIFALSVFGQGTFQNLDFESATTGQFGGFVSAASAIPDWTAELAGVPQTEIVQNGFSTGAAEVSLLTSIANQPPLEGNYSILLTGSFLGSASISQTGLIPAGMESLSFDAQVSPGSGNLAVLVGNQSVPFEPVASFSTYTRYSADISAWSGQTAQITFSALQDTAALNDWEIDNISFLPGTVPEPDAFTLISVRGLLFGLHRRFESTRKGVIKGSEHCIYTSRLIFGLCLGQAARQKWPESY